jgi:hypothetical protein
MRFTGKSRKTVNDRGTSCRIVKHHFHTRMVSTNDRRCMRTTMTEPTPDSNAETTQIAALLTQIIQQLRRQRRTGLRCSPR